MKVTFPVYLFALILASCQTEAERGPSAVLISEIEMSGFSSGSGMAQLGRTIYAVGDDDPFLWMLSADGGIREKRALWDSGTVKNGRIPKRIKPDFEAVTPFPLHSDTVLIVFASGSKSPQRDVLMLVDLRNGGRAERLPADTAFFRKLRAEVTPHLNLEGAAFRSGELILLNRSDNRMIRILQSEFSEFLNSGKVDPLTFEVHRYALPVLSGDSATFSGASVMSDGRTLLFSASVEATKNAVDDGKIRGSYTGILDLARPENPPVIALVTTKNGRPYLGKIEAAEGLFLDDGSIAVTAITDNDDGTTQFLKLIFQY